MSVSQPSVTVYVISHNYGRFLEAAVTSVLAQNTDGFEVIVIDDGSSDDTAAVLAKFASDPRVRLILQQNKGLTVTNNIALRAARGDYIMRLDGDDYLHPDAVATMRQALDGDPELGMVFPDYFEVDEAGEVLAEVRRHDFDDVTLMDQPAHGACTMIRRACLEEIGGYDETLGCQDGYDLWIRFIERYRVKNVSAPLFYYRQHGASLTRDERRILETRATILERHAKRRGHHLDVVAIVPIRGKPTDPGSPALVDLGGQPLMDWTVGAALGAGRIGTVVVTTPDDDILAHVAETWRGRVVAVKRDADLARANTFLTDTLRHALSVCERDRPAADAVMTLAIECPFRTARHIDAAVDVMELFDTDSVIGVRPETDPFYRHSGGGLEPVHEDIHLRLERDELYREVARMRLVRRGLLTEGDGVPRGRVGHVVVDQRGALELRTAFDWSLAGHLAADEAGG
ncbi:MAG: glycosyltransferase [Rhodospirillaceae bacterium]